MSRFEPRSGPAINQSIKRHHIHSLPSPLLLYLITCHTFILNMAAAGPSRLQATVPPPAPSTSGDSESTVPVPADKGLDVGILREVAKSALVESLNDVYYSSLIVVLS
jgi:hypothetical protein